MSVSGSDTNIFAEELNNIFSGVKKKKRRKRRNNREIMLYKEKLKEDALRKAAASMRNKLNGKAKKGVNNSFNIIFDEMCDEAINKVVEDGLTETANFIPASYRIEQMRYLKRQLAIPGNRLDERMKSMLEPIGRPKRAASQASSQAAAVTAASSSSSRRTPKRKKTKCLNRKYGHISSTDESGSVKTSRNKSGEDNYEEHGYYEEEDEYEDPIYIPAMNEVFLTPDVRMLKNLASELDIINRKPYDHDYTHFIGPFRDIITEKRIIFEEKLKYVMSDEAESTDDDGISREERIRQEAALKEQKKLGERAISELRKISAPASQVEVIEIDIDKLKSKVKRQQTNGHQSENDSFIESDEVDNLSMNEIDDRSSAGECSNYDMIGASTSKMAAKKRNGSYDSSDSNVSSKNSSKREYISTDNILSKIMMNINEEDGDAENILTNIMATMNDNSSEEEENEPITISDGQEVAEDVNFIKEEVVTDDSLTEDSIVNSIDIQDYIQKNCPPQNIQLINAINEGRDFDDGMNAEDNRNSGPDPQTPSTSASCNLPLKHITGNEEVSLFGKDIVNPTLKEVHIDKDAIDASTINNYDLASILAEIDESLETQKADKTPELQQKKAPKAKKSERYDIIKNNMFDNIKKLGTRYNIAHFDKCDKNKFFIPIIKLKSRCQLDAHMNYIGNFRRNIPVIKETMNELEPSLSCKFEKRALMRIKKEQDKGAMQNLLAVRRNPRKDVITNGQERFAALNYMRELKLKKTNLVLTCKICNDKHFTALATLINHYRSHAGIKPFICNICFETFTRQHSLNYHLLIHNNQSRFTCKECGRKFRHPSHYKEHLRRHTGETPYSCVECGNTYKTRNTYKRHLMSKHGKLLTVEGIFDLNILEYTKSKSNTTRSLYNVKNVEKNIGKAKQNDVENKDKNGQNTVGLRCNNYDDKESREKFKKSMGESVCLSTEDAEHMLKGQPIFIE